MIGQYVQTLERYSDQKYDKKLQQNWSYTEFAVLCIDREWNRFGTNNHMSCIEMC